jgi:hypothetical protein
MFGLYSFLCLLGINQLFERSTVVDHQETQAFLQVETNRLAPLFNPLFFGWTIFLNFCIPQNVYKQL